MGDAPGSRAPSTSGVDSTGDERVPVVVNGQAAAVSAGTTLADIVRACCDGAQGIAVARNREVVPRSQWGETPVASHDRVEIVTAAAGG